MNDLEGEIGKREGDTPEKGRLQLRILSEWQGSGGLLVKGWGGVESVLRAYRYSPLQASEIASLLKDRLREDGWGILGLGNVDIRVMKSQERRDGYIVLISTYIYQPYPEKMIREVKGELTVAELGIAFGFKNLNLEEDFLSFPRKRVEALLERVINNLGLSELKDDQGEGEGDKVSRLIHNLVRYGVMTIGEKDGFRVEVYVEGVKNMGVSSSQLFIRLRRKDNKVVSPVFRVLVHPIGEPVHKESDKKRMEELLGKIKGLVEETQWYSLFGI